MPAPETPAPAAAGADRRWRPVARGAAALCLALLLLWAAVWALVPLWLPPVLDALLARQGYQLLSVAVSRPGWTAWQIPRLRFGAAGQVVDLAQVGLGYRLPGLWNGRLDHVEVGHLSFTRLPAEPAAGDAGLGRGRGLDDLPARLEPEAWLQRLPWQSLRIAQLALRLPGTGVSATGRLQQSPEHLDAELVWHGVLPMAGGTTGPPLNFALRYQAGEALRLVLLGADGLESARLSTRLGGAALDLSLRVALAAAESRLLHALLGSAASLPAELARGRLAVRVQLPWPLPSGFGPDDIQGSGDFDLALRLPELEVPALSGVLAAADGTLRLTVDRLAARATGGESGGVALQCALAGPWPATLRADGWTLGSGLRCELAGGQDLLQLDLEEASGTLDALSGRAALAGRLRGFAPDGSLSLELRRRETGRLAGEASLELDGQQLPLTIAAAADGSSGELRFAHAYPLPERLLSRLALVPPTGSDLLGGDLAYEGALNWTADGVTARVEARATGLVIDHETLRTLEPPLALKPLGARVTLALSPAEVGFTGQAETAALRLPFAGTFDLDSGHLQLEAPFEHRVQRPLFAGLFERWPHPVELEAGLLNGTLSLAVAESARWSLEGALASGAGQLDDSPFSGLALRWEGAGDDDAFELATPADSPLAIARLDPGFPLAVIELPLRLAGGLADTQLAVGEGRVAAFGGAVRTAPFELAVASLDADFVLDLQGLALAQLLALEGEEVRGTGVLDGHLPVRLRDGALQISDGQIAARPPGGTIALSDSLAQSTGQPGLDFALQALTDFRYSDLSGAVSYAPSGELALALSLRGSNPAVERGRPIQYNLNLTNNIPQLLRSLRADRVLTEQVERRLNR